MKITFQIYGINNFFAFSMSNAWKTCPKRRLSNNHTWMEIIIIFFFLNIHTYKNYKKMLMLRNIQNRHNSWIMVNHVRYGLSVCLSLFFPSFPFFSSIKKGSECFDVLTDAYTILPENLLFLWIILDFFFLSCSSILATCFLRVLRYILNVNCILSSKIGTRIFTNKKNTSALRNEWHFTAVMR